mgnify:CR=1 FL=1
MKQKKKVITHVVNEFQRVYKAKDENVEYEKELNAELAKLQKTRQKYMDMYTDDLISREELNEKIGGSRQEMERIENELKMVSYHLTKGEQLENILNNTFKEIEDITDVHQMTNQQLKRLIQKGVKFHYRHRCVDLSNNQLTIENQTQQFSATYDAIILACGAVSWSQLGSDGAWQQWLSTDEIEPFQASNAGVLKQWSPFMQDCFGQPLKRVDAWVTTERKTHGDIIITHYGFESGVIYKLGRDLRTQLSQKKNLKLHLDLLPDLSIEQLEKKLQGNKKQSLTNLWRKAGLDQVKINLLREIVDKSLWSDAKQMVQQIKHLSISLDGFRPIEEAISCAGGVKQDILSPQLQLKSNPYVFCCGEMLDWDAPTGGYLLTACFATGRAAGQGVQHFLSR